MPVGVRRDGNINRDLVIDSVVTSQNELGPTIPDGGYGWVVFIATLFFQAIIPSILVVYGIFMAFLSLESDKPLEIIDRLWDEKLFYTPLFFCATWSAFDPTGRYLILHSSWPRLVGSAGTCLTCAGLLFLWMGMESYENAMYFIIAGSLTGCGASLQIAQCEILLSQYFRLKHSILVHVTQAVVALGFIVTPMVVGHAIIKYSLLKVTLWYQAVILQGLIACIAFRKPEYLRMRPRTYQYITDQQDDEEDVFSKNSKELQIRRQNSDAVQTITLNNDASISQASTSKPDEASKEETTPPHKNWETFGDEDDDGEEDVYVVNGNATIIDTVENTERRNQENWVTFEGDNSTISSPSPESLKLPYTINKDINYNTMNSSHNQDKSREPKPLYNTLEINMNNTYSFDDSEEVTEHHEPIVFMSGKTQQQSAFWNELNILKQPTFYKSLLMVITTKYSLLIFYVLFPPYLYLKVESLTIKRMSMLIGLLSTVTLFFSFVTYYINVKKERRAVWLWILCWMGSAGYFMLSDATTFSAFFLGTIQVIISISSLEHIGSPLLGLTVKGEATDEYSLLSILCGTSFLFLLMINFNYIDMFRFMAMLHFVTGSVWFANFIYKKISRIR